MWCHQYGAMETEREWQCTVCPAHMNEWLEEFSVPWCVGMSVYNEVDECEDSK